MASIHAVTAIAGTKNAQYCYDANGALVSGDNRTVTWGAFQLPTRIVQGTRAIDLVYGPDRARVKRIDSNETGLTTTHYVAGGGYEVATTSAGTRTAKLYIGSSAVVIDTEQLPGQHAIVTNYLLRDHLGSLDVVTDQAGVLQERLSFDAWGKRREVHWTAYVSPSGYAWQSKPITRGFLLFCLHAAAAR